MYIRKSIRGYKGKTYTNYVLVESVHTAKGPRQKTVCSLGDLSPRPRAEWLKLARKIEDALVGQDDLLDAADGEVADIVRRVRARRADRGEVTPAPSLSRTARGALIKVDPSRVTTERHREAGPVHVGHQFWQRLGLDRILRDCGLSAAAQRLACAMALNRLIAPCSEHAMPDWIRRTALADILGVDFGGLTEDPLDRVLDKLYPHRAAIEAALVARERSLFNLDATIYLYDLTSTYFEGECARNGKAKRGYSRDHRADCKQVVVGLVVSREGFPITHEVFAGNTQDRTTLAAMLDRLASAPACGKAQPWWSTAAWPSTTTSPRSRTASCTMSSPAASPSVTAGWPTSRTPTASPRCCASLRRSTRRRRRPRSRSRPASTAKRPTRCAAASSASPRTAPSAPSRKGGCARISTGSPSASPRKNWSRPRRSTKRSDA